MSARVRTLLGVLVMSAVLVLYFVLVGVRGVALLGSGVPLATIMGLALLVLPLIGLWALWRELRFGRDSTRLADRLDADGRLPDEVVATRPSGRPLREDADAAFPKYKAEVEADPSSWEAWMRLGVVYDASGDRKRARAAIREAIRLSRNEKR
ncbi:MAG: tetratricopeptide repeat protein [Leucobacter sp.]